MTDTETPIEAGARALHDRTYAGLDVRPWDMRTDAGRERFRWGCAGCVRVGGRGRASGRAALGPLANARRLR
jgi:hypothetical protein